LCSNTSGSEAPGHSLKQLVKKSKKQPQGSSAVDAGSHSPLYLNTLKVRFERVHAQLSLAQQH